MAGGTQEQNEANSSAPAGGKCFVSHCFIFHMDHFVEINNCDISYIALFYFHRCFLFVL